MFLPESTEGISEGQTTAMTQDIVDNNSTDETIDLLKDYKNSGFINFYSAPDTGKYDAINKGLLRAKGKYVAFLSCDDFYHDIMAIADLVNAMEEENADLTEDIYNKLRTAFVKKEIDPDYIGNVRPELYNKPFDFDITITDMNNRSIPELAMQIIRVDGTIENITLTEDNPKASVSLKHGDEVSLFNIPPEGMKYMVEEADYYSQGFISYVSVDDGAETRTRIARGQFGGEGQHSILYTNRPLPLPSTGGSGIQIFIEMSFALIMFGALLGLMYWLAKRKQLDKQLN